MFVIEWLSTPFFKALAWSLLHSLWQAAILYSLAWLIIHINKNAPARIKYNIVLSAQLGTVSWFLLTLFHINRVQTSIALLSSQLQQSAILFPARLPLLSGIYGEEPTSSNVIGLSNIIPLMLFIYLLGLLLMAIRTIIGYHKTQILKNRGLSRVDDTLSQNLQSILEKFQVNRKVNIYLSRLVDVPIMIGYIKPVILLPVSIMTHLSLEQIQAIIMHEVAHIRRMDYLLNLFQSLIETIFFFNPFVWLLSNTIREEREKACDELVIKEISPYCYATALLALEQARTSNHLAMAAIKSPSSLLTRIKIFTMKQNQIINFRQKVLSLSLIAISFCCVAWLTPGQAQSNQNDAKTETTRTFQKELKKIESQQNAADNNTAQSFEQADTIPDHSFNKNNFKQKARDKRIADLMNSPEWQKQVEEIKQNAAKISAEVTNNPAWNKEIENLQAKAVELSNRYRQSPDQQKALEKLQENAKKLSLQIANNPEFKQHIRSLRENAKKIAQQSIHSPEWNKNMEAISKQSVDYVNTIMNNSEWKINLKNIEAEAAKVSDHLENNKEFQKQLESITGNIQKMSDNFTNSPEFKNQIKAITKQALKLQQEASNDDTE